jgi:hypothetical protein
LVRNARSFLKGGDGNLINWLARHTSLAGRVGPYRYLLENLAVAEDACKADFFKDTMTLA